MVVRGREETERRESRELSRKQQGRVNVRSGPGYICVVGEKRLKEANVVDTKESGGRQYVEVR